VGGQVSEPDRAQTLDQQHGASDPAPVDPIGGPAGDERERGQRQELRDADHAELERCLLGAHPERAARDIVHLPADHHDHRILRDRRRETGQPIKSEITEREG